MQTAHYRKTPRCRWSCISRRKLYERTNDSY